MDICIYLRTLQQPRSHSLSSAKNWVCRVSFLTCHLPKLPILAVIGSTDSIADYVSVCAFLILDWFLWWSKVFDVTAVWVTMRHDIWYLIQLERLAGVAEPDIIAIKICLQAHCNCRTFMILSHNFCEMRKKEIKPKIIQICRHFSVTNKVLWIIYKVCIPQKWRWQIILW